MSNWADFKTLIPSFKTIEVDAPTLKTIICAENILLCLEQKSYPCPHHIIACPDKKIKIIWLYDLFDAHIELEDECAELLIFFDCRLIFRQKLQNCVI